MASPPAHSPLNALLPLPSTYRLPSPQPAVPHLRHRPPQLSPGWNLINEPRCYQCGATQAGWVREMAAYVKALDPNHLLTVGEEGFYAGGQPQVGRRLLLLLLVVLLRLV